MDRFLSDIRYAVRGLRRSPAFTFAAVTTLALGIGANVTIFTAINGVLLQPLPYSDPNALVRVWPEETGSFNKAMVKHLSEAMPAVESITGVSGWLFTLTGEGDPQQIAGAVVSWNHFQTLGVRPALGRAFTAEEGLVGEADVVILSHGLWTDTFGGDPTIIGKRLDLAAGQYPRRLVVGVMPEDFQPIDSDYRLWSPLDVDPAVSIYDDTSWYVSTVIARLAPGATGVEANMQVRAVAAALHDEWPARWTEEGALAASVVPLPRAYGRNVSTTLWTLLGAVVAVLLIACANVANLLLARGTIRAGDLAMRAALGASRRRLVAQMLVESFILGVLGGIAGLTVAYASLRLLASSAPEEFQRVSTASIDPWVTAFAFMVTLAAVLVFGLVPALRASRAGAGAGLAGASRGTADRGGHRLTQGLVAAEVALAVVLVAGAGIMLRSLWNLYTDDLGFNPRGALTFRISIPEGRFEGATLLPHYQQIWDAIDAVPGVEGAGGIHLLPLTSSNWEFPYVAEDHPIPEGAPMSSANHRVVTPSYFHTMGIPLLAGRAFEDRDTTGAMAVGMINKTMADLLWPDTQPVGKTINVFGSDFTVIGVVADIHQHSVRRETKPEMYRPFDQWPIGGMFAIVRTTGDPATLAPLVQQAVWSVDADAPLADMRPLSEVFGESVAGDRFVSLLIAAFGVLALALGALGVYGVTTYATSRRLNEFGVRMALGANRSSVLRQAVVDGITPALVGVAIGVGTAGWATTLLASLLHDVAPQDVTTFVAVPAILTTIAAIACALPAWRASRLDPITVLRND